MFHTPRPSPLQPKTVFLADEKVRYMKYPPGFQLLHCIRASGAGGESFFADAFYAAEVLYKTSPEDFEALCTFPVTYRYNKGGKFYTDTKVTIEIDRTKVCFSLTSYTRFTLSSMPRRPRADLIQAPKPDTGMPAIANINYAPPFQGPLTANQGTHDDGASLTAYVRAASHFQRIISAPENQISYMLRPGDCVVFNNRRVLHGRREFVSIGVKQGEERWLKGAYLDADDVASALRGSEAQAADERV